MKTEGTGEEADSEVRLRREILARMENLRLPADPAGEIERLLALANEDRMSIEAGALLVLWCREDPAGAAEFLKGWKGIDANKIYMRSVALEMAGEVMDTDALIGLLGEMEEKKYTVSDPLFAGKARRLIATRTVEELVAFIPRVPEKHKGGIVSHFANEWPVDRLDDFGKFATALDEPERFTTVADEMPRQDKAKWLVRFVQNCPDQDFARKVRESSDFVIFLRDSPDLPLETRLSEAEKIGPPKGPNSYLEYFADNDVPRFVGSEDAPDIRDAFEHGRMGIGEIMKMLSARFPEYAAAGLLESRLYEMLAPHDPVRAMELLRNLPEPERLEVLASANWNFRGANLETIAEAIRVLPRSHGPQGSDPRDSLWRTVTEYALDDYGQDYIRWIQQLPDPVDREMALDAIAYRIENFGASEASEIRYIIGDLSIDTPGRKRQ